MCQKKLGFFEKAFGVKQFNVVCRNCIQKTLKKEGGLKPFIQLLSEEEFGDEHKSYLSSYLDLFLLFDRIINIYTLECNLLLEEGFYKVKNVFLSILKLMLNTFFKNKRYELKNLKEILDDGEFINNVLEYVIYDVNYTDGTNYIYSKEREYRRYLMDEDLHRVFSDINSKCELGSNDWSSNVEEYLISKRSIIKNIFSDNSRNEFFNLEAIELTIGTMFAFGFVRLIAISKYVNQFKDHNELYTIWSNLFYADLETYVIHEKLYPIYMNFYENDFDHKFSKDQFLDLLCLVQEECIHSTDNTYLECIPSDITLACSKNEVEQKLIEICTHDFLEEVDEKNCLHDKRIIINIILRNILAFNKDEFDWISVFEIHKNINGWKEKIKEKYDIADLEVEKERLLQGDLFKEKQYVRDKWNYSNISNGYEFEEYLVGLFEYLGFKVQLTPKSNDQGADLIIEKDYKKIAVQAKYYNSPVGNKAVQEVKAAIDFYKADRGLVITNSSFTKAAIELAEANAIKLINGMDLTQIKESFLA